MGTASRIEWLDGGGSWNPLTGCDKVSAGCKFCYAERVALDLQSRGVMKYNRGFKLTLQPQDLHLPLTWRKPKRVFVNSMSDLFHESVPTDYILAVFGVMALADWHDYIILTKRPDRMMRIINSYSDFVRSAVAELVVGPGVCEWALRPKGFPASEWPFSDDQGRTSYGPSIAQHLRIAGRRIANMHGAYLTHVILGVSAENQDTLEERCHYLRNTPAYRRAISFGPLIDKVTMFPKGGSAPLGMFSCTSCGGEKEVRGGRKCLDCLDHPSKADWHGPTGLGIHWAIVEGEAGSPNQKVRPMLPAFALNLRDECIRVGVPLHFKQWGDYNAQGDRVGKIAAGRLLEGREWNEYPCMQRVDHARQPMEEQGMLGGEAWG
jgi:protein gp37